MLFSYPVNISHFDCCSAGLPFNSEGSMTFYEALLGTESTTARVYGSWQVDYAIVWMKAFTGTYWSELQKGKTAAQAKVIATDELIDTWWNDPQYGEILQGWAGTHGNSLYDIFRLYGDPQSTLNRVYTGSMIPASSWYYKGNGV